MNAATSRQDPLLDTKTTTVFTSGNSQAVRLPKEFRFSAKTVEIFRRGDEIVLREKPLSLGEALAGLFAGLPPLTEEDQKAFEHIEETRQRHERDFPWRKTSKKKRRKIKK